MYASTAEKRVGALGRMAIVAALHGVALLLIMKGLGVTPHILALPPDIDTTLVPDERTPEVIPNLPDVEYTNTDVHVPMPDQPIEAEDQPLDPIHAEVMPPDGVEIGPGSAVPEPMNLVSVRADPRRPLSQPPYPASLIRSGTEGSVDVEVLVQPNGRVADARIARTSGYDLFDRATLEEARRNWRLLPATRNGEPYAQWYRLRVVFKLKNPQ